jgi:pimeloyl-ACP methyl ester carboxylesterase
MMANRPVLVSQVRADFIFPAANVTPLAERIPGERLYLVTGGRHGYFLEFSDEAGGLVVDFLQGHRLG